MPTPAEIQQNTFGSAMALVEIVRLLNNIDKKLYVVIKKLESTPYEEDKEPEEDDEPD